MIIKQRILLNYVKGEQIQELDWFCAFQTDFPLKVGLLASPDLSRKTDPDKEYLDSWEGNTRSQTEQGNPKT